MALASSNNADSCKYRVDSNADIKFENFLFRNWLKNCFLLSIPENWAVQIRKWRIEES